MLVHDLHVTRHSKRTSARKHEGMRVPTARNAIVRDRISGSYEAKVDVTLSELHAQRLRINALELEVSRLKREGAVSSGYAAPIVGATTSNVIPMTTARKPTGKESAVQVSHPLPVAGNEALALPSPSEEPPRKESPVKLVPTGKVNPVHLPHTSQAVRASSVVAANDEVVDNKEAVDSLRDITDVPAADVATLAQGYGMTLEEASEILYREYSKRELHCYDKHGQSREVVRLERHMRQHIKCLPGGYVQVAHCTSGFSGWWMETEARMKHLRGEAIARRVREQRSPTDHAPWVKGEAKYRRKKFLADRAAAKPQDRAAFSRVQTISRKLTVEPRVTTASQVAAIGTWGFEMYQKTRKLLGMKPTVRSMAERTRAELVLDLEASREADLVKKAGIVPPSEAEYLPIGELVRRYQRNGIGP